MNTLLAHLSRESMSLLFDGTTYLNALFFFLINLIVLDLFDRFGGRLAVRG